MAINPNQEQLNAIGIAAKKDPEYLHEDMVRINVWCQSLFTKEELVKHGMKEQIVVPASFQVSPAAAVYEGTYTWINTLGVTAKGTETEPPTDEWFKPTGARVAYKGEKALIGFIRAWVNASEGDEVSLDTWEDIFRGNVKELRELLAAYPENVVCGMMQIRERTTDNRPFHELFPYHFERWNRSGTLVWQSFFTRYKIAPRGVWSYDITEYEPKAAPVEPDADASEDASTESKW